MLSMAKITQIDLKWNGTWDLCEPALRYVTYEPAFGYGVLCENYAS